MIVIDASVAFKWLADEDPLSTAKAREVLATLLEGTDQAWAPDILLYEIANILSCKTNLEIKDITDAWNRFISYPIKFLNPDSTFINKCLQLSIKHKITIYDASYILLAQEKQCQFVTSDKKLTDKVNLSFVQNLSQYKI